jgi:NCS1 family nucleobase:cation symporter-1
MIFLGFYATGLVLGGQAMSNLLHISTQLGAVIFAVMSTVLAIYGYRHIHRFSHFAAVLSGVVFLGLFVRILVDPQTGTAFAHHAFAAAPFILGISLAASWQLTFGPYIADYSRYLPESTPKSATIGWTFLGSVAGGSLAMVLGALVAAIGGKAFLGDQVGYLAHVGGPLSALVLLAVICGKLTGDTLSTYGGYMSVVTIVTSLTGEKTVRPRHRTLYICVISAAALAIALAATDTFLSTFTNFLLFLLYFMTPWSAINLVDYYWVRRERYRISELFNPRGTYGRVNKGAFVAYVIGVAIQIPFMNSSLYVGPIANWMGGAEVAWVLGLIVAGGLYYLLSAGVRRGNTANYDHIIRPATPVNH